MNSTGLSPFPHLQFEYTGFYEINEVIFLESSTSQNVRRSKTLFDGHTYLQQQVGLEVGDLRGRTISALPLRLYEHTT